MTNQLDSSHLGFSWVSVGFSKALVGDECGQTGSVCAPPNYHLCLCFPIPIPSHVPFECGSNCTHNRPKLPDPAPEFQSKTLQKCAPGVQPCSGGHSLAEWRGMGMHPLKLYLFECEVPSDAVRVYTQEATEQLLDRQSQSYLTDGTQEAPPAFYAKLNTMHTVNRFLTDMNHVLRQVLASVSPHSLDTTQRYRPIPPP